MDDHPGRARASLLRESASAATAIPTLALGIGANTAIFSYGVSSAAAVSNPSGCGAHGQPVRRQSAASGRQSTLTTGAQAPEHYDLAVFLRGRIDGVDLTGRGAPRRLAAVFVTPGFFAALGVQPGAGRLPREDELVRGGRDTVVLLTHGFWTREFGASPGIVGSMLSLNGRPFEVIGVLPPGLRFPTGEADVFVPYSTIPDSGIPRLRQVRVLNVVARAKAGVSVDVVRSELNTIAARLAGQYSEDRAWDSATVVPLADVISGPVAEGLVLLFGAVGLVLLMAAVNVTSLQLARAAVRGREIAVRLALGARRGRLVRQLLTESLVLSAIGGAVGIGLAAAGLQGLLALAAGQLPRAAEVSLNATVILFALGVSIVTGVLVGLAPAWRLSRGGVQSALRDGDLT